MSARPIAPSLRRCRARAGGSAKCGSSRPTSPASRNCSPGRRQGRSPTSSSFSSSHTNEPDQRTSTPGTSDSRRRYSRRTRRRSGVLSSGTSPPLGPPIQANESPVRPRPAVTCRVGPPRRPPAPTRTPPRRRRSPRPQLRASSTPPAPASGSPPGIDADRPAKANVPSTAFPQRLSASRSAYGAAPRSGVAREVLVSGAVVVTQPVAGSSWRSAAAPCCSRRRPPVPGGAFSLHERRVPAGGRRPPAHSHRTGWRRSGSYLLTRRGGVRTRRTGHSCRRRELRAGARCSYPHLRG